MNTLYTKTAMLVHWSENSLSNNKAEDRRYPRVDFSVSRQCRELFGPEKPGVKLQTTWFEKLIF